MLGAERSCDLGAVDNAKASDTAGTNSAFGRDVHRGW